MRKMIVDKQKLALKRPSGSRDGFFKTPMMYTYRTFNGHRIFYSETKLLFQGSLILIVSE